MGPNENYKLLINYKNNDQFKVGMFDKMLTAVGLLK